MEDNKIKNIVCNKTNSTFILECERFIEEKLKGGWDILTVQDCIIVALQNKLNYYNY